MLHHFNPRFPRGKRRGTGGVQTGKRQISIHASREGSDSAIKAAPIYRIWHHGFREPGFSGSFHQRFPCFFPLGTGGSHLPNVRHIAASHFFYYTISNGCPSSISCLYISKSPLKAQKLPEIPQVTGPCTGRPGFEVFRKFCFVSIFQPADKKRTFRCPVIPPSMDTRRRDILTGDGSPRFSVHIVQRALWLSHGFSGMQLTRNRNRETFPSICPFVPSDSKSLPARSPAYRKDIHRILIFSGCLNGRHVT